MIANRSAWEREVDHPPSRPHPGPLLEMSVDDTVTQGVSAHPASGVAIRTPPSASSALASLAARRVLLRIGQLASDRGFLQALGLVAGLRISLGLIGYAGLRLYPGLGQPVDDPITKALLVPDSSRLWPFVGPWQRWDGLQYELVARVGYHTKDKMALRAPLYPGLVRGTSYIVGNSIGLAALVVSTVSLAAALTLLHRMVRTDVGASVADRTLLYICVAPTSLFLVADYPESLFLLLTVGAVLAARRRRFVVAGLAGGLAAVTRTQGFVIAAPLIVEAVIDALDRRRRGLPAFSVGHLGCLFPLLAVYGWDRYINARLFPGGLQALAAAQSHVTTQLGQPLYDGIRLVALHPSWDKPEAFIDLGAVLLAFATLAFMIRRVPWSYVVLTAASLLALMVQEDVNEPLSSDSRYVLVIFPVFVAMALWGRRSWVDRLILVSFAPLLGVAMFHYAHFRFVA